MWNPVWDSILSDREWGKYPSEELIRFVARSYYKVEDRASVSILEIGSGAGANVWFIAREGFSFVGLDGSAAGVNKAAKRLDGECPGWRERGDLIVGEAEALPFGDGTFDAVIDIEAVSCNDFDASMRIYAEANRVTKPNGKIFVRTFAGDCWGAGTGAQLGEKFWEVAEGPLEGIGAVRFTDIDDLPSLLSGYHVESIEAIHRTAESRTRRISEWIVEGVKR